MTGIRLVIMVLEILWLRNSGTFGLVLTWHGVGS